MSTGKPLKLVASPEDDPLEDAYKAAGRLSIALADAIHSLGTTREHLALCAIHAKTLAAFLFAVELASQTGADLVVPPPPTLPD